MTEHFQAVGHQKQSSHSGKAIHQGGFERVGVKRDLEQSGVFMLFFPPRLHRCIDSNKVLSAWSHRQRRLGPTAAGWRDLTLLAKVHSVLCLRPQPIKPVCAVERVPIFFHWRSLL